MEPYCDSDEEVFFGPPTAKEIKKILSLRRKTEIFDPLKTESIEENTDESSRKSLYIPQPSKQQVFRKRWNSCEGIEVGVTDGDKSPEMPAPPPSPEHEDYVGSPYPTPCRFRRQPSTSLAGIAEEELYPSQSTPKAVPPRFSEYSKFGDWRDSHAISYTSDLSASFSRASDNEDANPREMLIARMKEHEAKTQKLRGKKKQLDSSVEVLEDDKLVDITNERTADSEYESYEKHSRFSRLMSERDSVRSQVALSDLEVQNAVDRVTSLSNARLSSPEFGTGLSTHRVSGAYAVVAGNYSLISDAGEEDAMELRGDEQYPMSEADEATVDGEGALCITAPEEEYQRNNEDYKQSTSMDAHKETSEICYISKVQPNETQAKEEERYFTDAKRLSSEEFMRYRELEADVTELSLDENAEHSLSKADNSTDECVILEVDEQVKSVKNNAFLLTKTGELTRKSDDRGYLTSETEVPDNDSTYGTKSSEKFIEKQKYSNDNRNDELGYGLDDSIDVVLVDSLDCAYEMEKMNEEKAHNLEASNNQSCPSLDVLPIDSLDSAYEMEMMNEERAHNHLSQQNLEASNNQSCPSLEQSEVSADADGGFLKVLSEAALYHASRKQPISDYSKEDTERAQAQLETDRDDDTIYILDTSDEHSHREMNALSDLNESDVKNLDDIKSFNSSDGGFHDTLEEMEMMLKHGLDYMTDGKDLQELESSHERSYVNSSVSLPNTPEHNFADLDARISKDSASKYKTKIPQMKQKLQAVVSPTVHVKPNIKPSPFKVPVKPPLQMRSAKKSPLKPIITTPSKKLYSKIMSPVSAYIHNNPSPSLVTTVRPKTSRHIGSPLLNPEVRCTSEERENIDISNVRPVLPEVSYKSVPCVKLQEIPETRMPRMNEKMKKLMDTPRPLVIKHKGRMRVSPSPNNRGAAVSLDDSSTEAEISVVLGKEVTRTNTLWK